LWMFMTNSAIIVYIIKKITNEVYIYIICPAEKELTTNELQRVQDYIGDEKEFISSGNDFGSVFCKINNDFLAYDEICDLMVGADEIHVWKKESNTVFFELGILQMLVYAGLIKTIVVANKNKKVSPRMTDIIKNIKKDYDTPENKHDIDPKKEEKYATNSYNNSYSSSDDEDPYEIPF